MKIKIVICLTALLCISCKTVVDSKKSIETENYAFKLKSFDNYNQIKTNKRSPINVEGDVYIRQNFVVNIPKHIINWRVLGNQYLFEYNNQEIIIIDAGFESSLRTESWKLINGTYETKDQYLWDYWLEKKYDEKFLEDSENIKIYTDGKTNIIFFNIKQDNFKNYFNLSKSFVYK